MRDNTLNFKYEDVKEVTERDLEKMKKTEFDDGENLKATIERSSTILIKSNPKGSRLPGIADNKLILVTPMSRKENSSKIIPGKFILPPK